MSADTVVVVHILGRAMTHVAVLAFLLALGVVVAIISSYRR